MKGYKSLCNVNLLYFICLISILNIIWFAFYNQRCILIFLCCCLAIYIINKNMIFVLGLSLILVDSLYLFNLVKKEGFLGDDTENDASNNLLENDASNNLLENDASNNLLESINNETFTNINEESDEETNYVHDKSTMKKLKQLNPNMIDTISNMNSIKEINKTINNLRDNIDP